MVPGWQLVETARDWLGVPFLHQGRTRLGVDCIGFVAAAAGDVGVSDFLVRLPANYSRAPQGELFAGLAAAAARVEVPEAGDVVLIQWPRAAHPSHVAIYTGETIIHCYQRAGRVVEHGFREPWLNRAHSFWRIPGMYV